MSPHPTRPNPTKHGWIQPMPISESARSFYLLLITKLVALVRRFNARGAHNFQSCVQFRLQLMALSTYRLGIGISPLICTTNESVSITAALCAAIPDGPFGDGRKLLLTPNDSDTRVNADTAITSIRVLLICQFFSRCGSVTKCQHQSCVVCRDLSL